MKAAERYNEDCRAIKRVCATRSRTKAPLERKREPQNAYVCLTLPHQRRDATGRSLSDDQAAHGALHLAHRLVNTATLRWTRAGAAAADDART